MNILFHRAGDEHCCSHAAGSFIFPGGDRDKSSSLCHLLCYLQPWHSDSEHFLCSQQQSCFKFPVLIDKYFQKTPQPNCLPEHTPWSNEHTLTWMKMLTDFCIFALSFPLLLTAASHYLNLDYQPVQTACLFISLRQTYFCPTFHFHLPFFPFVYFSCLQYCQQLNNSVSTHVFCSG